MLFFLLQQSLAESPCSSLITNKQFVQQLDSAELGFVVADMKKIDAAMNTLQQSIPCLASRLLPEKAAQYHILKGLQAWIGDNEAEMTRSFSVARKTDSQAKIAKHVFPEDHIIHEIYDKVAPAEYEEIETEPLRGSYSFDGYLIPRRPKNTPTVFQIVDKKKILYSSYLETDASLPNIIGRSTYHRPIALSVSAISMLVGVGFQIHSQILRLEYENIRSSLVYDGTVDSLAPLQYVYEQHQQQYNHSVFSMLVSVGLFGFSFALEW